MLPVSCLMCGSGCWKLAGAPALARNEFFLHTVNDSTDDLMDLAIAHRGRVRRGESRAQGGESLFSERLECASSSCWSKSRPAQEASNAAAIPSLASVEIGQNSYPHLEGQGTHCLNMLQIY